MRTPSYKRLYHYARIASAPFRSIVTILEYHRIYDATSDTHNLCVSPSHFIQQLEFLRQNYKIISLHELGKGLETGRLPRRGVVLTFDDGYGDNFFNLLPILEQYAVPATVLITTGPVQTKQEFWWYRVDTLLLDADDGIPEYLELSIQGSKFKWPMTNPDERGNAYSKIYKILVNFPIDQIENVISQIVRWRGKEIGMRQSHRPLLPEEIQQLAKSGLVEIGAHSVSHANLPTLSPEKQWEEVFQSKSYLEEVIQGPVTSFSYPYNNADDLLCRVIERAGFQIACAARGGAVRRGANIFCLGRMKALDCDVDIFEQGLKKYFRE